MTQKHFQREVKPMDNHQRSTMSLVDVVQARLSPKRWEHTLRVAEYTAHLARRFGLDETKAMTAALLHDGCKEYSDAELRVEAQKAGFPLDDFMVQHIGLLHGPVAALWADREGLCRDSDVLEAIFCHSSGAPGVGSLAMILYIADKIEPGRPSTKHRDDLRLLVENVSLSRATMAVIDNSLSFLIAHQEAIAPQTFLWRNALLLSIEAEEKGV